jgi:hypothetical protein
VIPLTGVTFPFVSFGMTSLVLNMAMLGLALNVNARARSRMAERPRTSRHAAATRHRCQHGGRAGAPRRAADGRVGANGDTATPRAARIAT